MRVAKADTVIECQNNAVLSFDFALEGTNLARDGNDLVIIFPDGHRLTLRGFYEATNLAFEFEGSRFPADTFLENHLETFVQQDIPQNTEEMPENASFITPPHFSVASNEPNAINSDAFVFPSDAPVSTTTPAFLSDDIPVNILSDTPSADTDKANDALSTGNNAVGVTDSDIVGLSWTPIEVPNRTIYGVQAHGAHGKVIQKNGTWYYVLTEAVDSADKEGGVLIGGDHVQLIVTDKNNNFSVVDMDIDIVDSIPEMRLGDDFTLQSGATVTGSGLKFDFGADNWESDLKGLQVTVGEKTVNIPDLSNFQVEGEYGTLFVEGGNYRYEAKPNIAGTDTFSFRLTDADGDPVTADINGKTSMVFTTILPDAPNTPDTPEAPTLAIQVSEYTALTNGRAVNVSVPKGYEILGDRYEGDYGYIEKGANGRWTFTLIRPFDHEGEGKDWAENADTISVQMRDANGNLFDVNIPVRIQDDLPTINLGKTPSIYGETGDHIEGAEKLSFSFGADNGDKLDADGNLVRRLVVTPAKGETVTVHDLTTSFTIEGEYGTLTLTAQGDGTYTYTYDAKPVTPETAGFTVGQDSFTFTITDADGDTVSQNAVKKSYVISVVVWEPDAPVLSLTIDEHKDIVDGLATALALPEGYTILSAGKAAYGDFAQNEDGVWEYKLSSAIDHGGKNDGRNTIEAEEIAVTVEDEHGNIFAVTIPVKVIDDRPTAENLTNDITEGQASVTGAIPLMPGADELGSFAFKSGTAYKEVTGETVFKGTYGELHVKADGTYEYFLDNENPKVTALTDGKTIRDTFNYRVTDTDGDIANARVTVTIKGVDNGILLTPDTAIEFDEKALVDGQITRTGVFDIEAPDGVANIRVAGLGEEKIIPLDGSHVTFEVENEVLDLHYANGQIRWSYTLKDAAQHEGGSLARSFDITVTDTDKTSATSKFIVTVLDDEPELVVPETLSVASGFTATLTDVITDFGADKDGATLTITTLAGGDGVTGTGPVLAGLSIQGAYGDLVFEDGVWTYTARKGATGEDVFTFTITDADGDTKTASLTVTVTEPVTPVIDAIEVHEKNIGGLTDFVPEGFRVVRVETQGVHGKVVEEDSQWFYRLDENIHHAPVQGENIAEHADEVTLVLEDAGGNQFTVTVPVNIQDDVPELESQDWTWTLSENDESATGNVLKQRPLNAFEDEKEVAKPGADGASVVWQNTETVDGVTIIRGKYGDMRVDADGNFTYTLHSDITGLYPDKNGVDTFYFEYVDADGDKALDENGESLRTVVMKITGSDSPVIIGEPDVLDIYEANLADGTNPKAEELTQHGSVTFKADDGLKSIQVSHGGKRETLSFTPDEDGTYAPLIIEDACGTFTITYAGMDENAKHKLIYSFTLTDNITNLNGENGEKLPSYVDFKLVVTDEYKDEVEKDIRIRVHDDAPTDPVDLHFTLTEDGLAENGYTFTGTIANQFQKGADRDNGSGDSGVDTERFGLIKFDGEPYEEFNENGEFIGYAVDYDFGEGFVGSLHYDAMTGAFTLDYNPVAALGTLKKDETRDVDFRYTYRDLDNDEVEGHLIFTFTGKDHGTTVKPHWPDPDPDTEDPDDPTPPGETPDVPKPTPDPDPDDPDPNWGINEMGEGLLRVHEAGLNEVNEETGEVIRGTLADAEGVLRNTTAHGLFDICAPDGLTNLKIVVDGEEYTLFDENGIQKMDSIEIAGGIFTARLITLRAENPLTEPSYRIKYSFTLQENVDHEEGQGANILPVSLTVEATNVNETVGKGVIKLEVVDDVPTIRAPEEDFELEAGGNVSFDLGIDFGADSYATDKAWAVVTVNGEEHEIWGAEETITGSAGTLTISRTGMVSYEARTEGTDAFALTLFDGDGDEVSAGWKVGVTKPAMEFDFSLLADEKTLGEKILIEDTIVIDGKVYTITASKGATSHGHVVEEDGRFYYVLDEAVQVGFEDNGRNIVEDQDSFAVTVSDENGNTWVASYDVDIKDDVPVWTPIWQEVAPTGKLSLLADEAGIRDGVKVEIAETVVLNCVTYSVVVEEQITAHGHIIQEDGKFYYVLTEGVQADFGNNGRNIVENQDVFTVTLYNENGKTWEVEYNVNIRDDVPKLNIIFDSSFEYLEDENIYYKMDSYDVDSEYFDMTHKVFDLYDIGYYDFKNNNNDEDDDMPPAGEDLKFCYIGKFEYDFGADSNAIIEIKTSYDYEVFNPYGPNSWNHGKTDWVEITLGRAVGIYGNIFYIDSDLNIFHYDLKAGGCDNWTIVNFAFRIKDGDGDIIESPNIEIDTLISSAGNALPENTFIIDEHDGISARYEIGDANITILEAYVSNSSLGHIVNENGKWFYVLDAGHTHGYAHDKNSEVVDYIQVHYTDEDGEHFEELPLAIVDDIPVIEVQAFNADTGRGTLVIDFGMDNYDTRFQALLDGVWVDVVTGEKIGGFTFAEDGSFSYTGASDLTLRVRDGDGDEATITIEGCQAPTIPVASEITPTVLAGEELLIGKYIASKDGTDTLIITAFGESKMIAGGVGSVEFSGGIVEARENGEVYFIPNGSLTGQENIELIIRDADGDTAIWTQGVNVELTVAKPDIELSLLADEAHLGEKIALAENIVIDGVTYTITASEGATSHGHIIEEDGKFYYVLDEAIQEDFGNNERNIVKNGDAFSITLSDENGNSFDSQYMVDIQDDVPAWETPYWYISDVYTNFAYAGNVFNVHDLVSDEDYLAGNYPPLINKGQICVPHAETIVFGGIALEEGETIISAPDGSVKYILNMTKQCDTIFLNWYYERNAIENEDFPEWCYGNDSFRFHVLETNGESSKEYAFQLHYRGILISEGSPVPSPMPNPEPSSNTEPSPTSVSEFYSTPLNLNSFPGYKYYPIYYSTSVSPGNERQEFFVNGYINDNSIFPHVSCGDEVMIGKYIASQDGTDAIIVTAFGETVEITGGIGSVALAGGVITAQEDGYVYFKVGETITWSGEQAIELTIRDMDGDTASWTQWFDIEAYGFSLLADEATLGEKIALKEGVYINDDGIAIASGTYFGYDNVYTIIATEGPTKHGHIVEEDGKFYYVLDEAIQMGFADDGRNVVEFQDSFTVTLRDKDGNTFEAEYRVDIKDDVPEINGASSVSVGGEIATDILDFSFGADGPGQIGYLANGVFTPFAGQEISGKHGTLVINADGSWTYTPNEGAYGSESFEILVRDADGDITRAPLDIEVLEGVHTNLLDEASLIRGSSVSAFSEGSLAVDAENPVLNFKLPDNVEMRDEAGNLATAFALPLDGSERTFIFFQEGMEFCKFVGHVENGELLYTLELTGAFLNSSLEEGTHALTFSTGRESAVVDVKEYGIDLTAAKAVWGKEEKISDAYYWREETYSTTYYNNSSLIIESVDKIKNIKIFSDNNREVIFDSSINSAFEINNFGNTERIEHISYFENSYCSIVFNVIDESLEKINILTKRTFDSWYIESGITTYDIICFEENYMYEESYMINVVIEDVDGNNISKNILISNTNNKYIEIIDNPMPFLKLQNTYKEGERETYSEYGVYDFGKSYRAIEFGNYNLIESIKISNGKFYTNIDFISGIGILETIYGNIEFRYNPETGVLFYYLPDTLLKHYGELENSFSFDICINGNNGVTYKIFNSGEVFLRNINGKEVGEFTDSGNNIPEIDFSNESDFNSIFNVQSIDLYDEDIRNSAAKSVINTENLIITNEIIDFINDQAYGVGSFSYSNGNLVFLREMSRFAVFENSANIITKNIKFSAYDDKGCIHDCEFKLNFHGFYSEQKLFYSMEENIISEEFDYAHRHYKESTENEKFVIYFDNFDDIDYIFFHVTLSGNFYTIKIFDNGNIINGSYNLLHGNTYNNNIYTNIIFDRDYIGNLTITSESPATVYIDDHYRDIDEAGGAYNYDIGTIMSSSSIQIINKDGERIEKSLKSFNNIDSAFRNNECLFEYINGNYKDFFEIIVENNITYYNIYNAKNNNITSFKFYENDAIIDSDSFSQIFDQLYNLLNCQDYYSYYNLSFECIKDGFYISTYCIWNDCPHWDEIIGSHLITYTAMSLSGEEKEYSFQLNIYEETKEEIEALKIQSLSDEPSSIALVDADDEQDISQNDTQKEASPTVLENSVNSDADSNAVLTDENQETIAISQTMVQNNEGESDENIVLTNLFSSDESLDTLVVPTNTNVDANADNTPVSNEPSNEKPSDPNDLTTFELDKAVSQSENQENQESASEVLRENIPDEAGPAPETLPDLHIDEINSAMREIENG